MGLLGVCVCVGGGDLEGFLQRAENTHTHAYTSKRGTICWKPLIIHIKQLVWIQTACVLITGSAAPPDGHITVSSHRFTPPAIEPFNVCEVERAAMLLVPYLICSFHWFNWLKGKFKWRRQAARPLTGPSDRSVSRIPGQRAQASLTKTNRSGGRL